MIRRTRDLRFQCLFPRIILPYIPVLCNNQPDSGRSQNVRSSSERNFLTETLQKRRFFRNTYRWSTHEDKEIVARWPKYSKMTRENTFSSKWTWLQKTQSVIGVHHHYDEGKMSSYTSDSLCGLRGFDHLPPQPSVSLTEVPLDLWR